MKLLHFRMRGDLQSMSWPTRSWFSRRSTDGRFITSVLAWRRLWTWRMTSRTDWRTLPRGSRIQQVKRFYRSIELSNFKFALLGKDVEKELSKVQELIKANIQRSKVIQDQVSEAKDNCQTIFEHKPKIQDIILKYQSKRDRTVKGRRDT